jgi:hypothetical protein
MIPEAFDRPFHRSETPSIAYSIGTSIGTSIGFDLASIGLLPSPHTPRAIEAPAAAWAAGATISQKGKV